MTIHSNSQITLDSLEGTVNSDNIELLPTTKLGTVQFTSEKEIEATLIALVEEAQTVIELLKAEVGAVVLTSNKTLKILLPLSTQLEELV